MATGLFINVERTDRRRENMLAQDVVETGVAVAQSNETDYCYTVQLVVQELPLLNSQS